MTKSTAIFRLSGDQDLFEIDLTPSQPRTGRLLCKGEIFIGDYFNLVIPTGEQLKSGIWPETVWRVEGVGPGRNGLTDVAFVEEGDLAL